MTKKITRWNVWIVGAAVAAEVLVLTFSALADASLNAEDGARVNRAWASGFFVFAQDRKRSRP